MSVHAVGLTGAWKLREHRPIVRQFRPARRCSYRTTPDQVPIANDSNTRERAGARRANGEHRSERFLRRCGATSFVPTTPPWSDVEQRSTSVQMSRTRAMTTPGSGENNGWRSCPAPAPSSRRSPARG
jgi:hypothetical protein